MGVQAFIDESGQRASTRASSDHFVMGAVIIRDEDIERSVDLLETIRSEIGRRSGDHLHWINIKTHSQRLRVAQLLGQAPFLTISSVVVCKRFFGPEQAPMEEDPAYLFTLRFLLERLSWLARDRHSNAELDYTLAHISRFELSKLRQYEARLRATPWPQCKVHWPSLPRGGTLSHGKRVEQLQLADLATSAIAKAFEADRYGFLTKDYIHLLAPRLYRYRGGSPSTRLTSYGLKMHPWNAAAKVEYRWVLDL